MSERADRRAALMQRLLSGVARRMEAMGHGPTTVDYIAPVDPEGDQAERAALEAEAAQARDDLRAIRVKLIAVLRSFDDLEDGGLDGPDGVAVLRGREMALEERVAELEREIDALAARWESRH